MRQALIPGVAAGLAFGTALGVHVGAIPWALVGGLLLLTTALIRGSTLSLWAAALCAGLALPQSAPMSDHLDHQLPGLTSLTGRVVGMPDPRRASVGIVVDVGAAGGPQVRVQAYVPPEAAPGPGDTVRLEGRWVPAEPEPWAAQLARRGIRGLFLASSCTVIATGPPGPHAWATELRRAALGRLARSLPDEGYRLMAALLLGARGLLPDHHAQAFREAGVAHLLALSGLHVGILAAGAWWLLGRLRLRHSWCYVLLIPLIAFYVLVGGARVSLIRAAAMFAVLGAFVLLWDRGWVLRGWFAPLSGLSCVAIGVLTAWPWSVFEAGFQLSFMATGAILVLLPTWWGAPLRQKLPWLLKRPADLLAVTACAQAGAVPIIGAAFGYVALYGLLANLVLVPWTGLLLWTGLALFLFDPVLGPGVGAWVHRSLIAPYLKAVETIAELPGAVLPVAPGFGLWCLLVVLGVLVLRAIRDELDHRGYPEHLVQHS